MAKTHAQLGPILELSFLLLAWITGNPVCDALGSICLGVILVAISAFVGWRVNSLLIGRSADPDVEAAINAMERQLKERIPGLRWCFVEPDIAD